MEMVHGNSIKLDFAVSVSLSNNRKPFFERSKGN